MDEKIAHIPRLMFAAVSSGSGKTTVVCAFLKALQKRNLIPSAFKCGPDYIDPLFHEKVMGINSMNLDLFMCGETAVKYLLARGALGTDIAVVEGVMGLYDGAGASDQYSSNHLSLATNTPVILVLSPEGVGFSVAAQIFGFLKFRANNVAGVILNRVSPAMFIYYKDLIERELGINVYGYMPMVKDAEFSSISLGLDAAEEDIQLKLELLSESCERYIDIDGLIKLAESNSYFTYDATLEPCICLATDEKVKIAVAYDEAFTLQYSENLELFKMFGVELCFFSPLRDDTLPLGAQGIILGGCLIKEYIKELSANKAMLEHIQKAAEGNIPIYAEAGGFTYLCESLSLDGKVYPLAGVISGRCNLTNSVVNFGYSQLTALKDTMLCSKGDRIRVHEFHYDECDNGGEAFSALKANGRTWRCIHADEHIFAGYPQIHFWQNVDMLKKFINKCITG